MSRMTVSGGGLTDRRDQVRGVPVLLSEDTLGCKNPHAACPGGIVRS